MRYIVEELRPVWVREFYEVDAENKEGAETAYLDGDYNYLGHTLSDNVEYVDSETQGYTEMPEGLPCELRHVADWCAAAPELLEALQEMVVLYGDSAQYDDSEEQYEVKAIKAARAAIAKATD